MFRVFQKKLIYKEKYETVKKEKNVKNVIIKKSAAKIFQVCVIMVYRSFILKLSISTTLFFWR